MSTFDIEAAKRGESVELKYHTDEWIPAHFIGPSVISKNEMVVEVKDTVRFAHPSILRMAPKKVKVRWRVALIGSDLTLIANDEGHERVLESGEWGEFKQWLTDWQEAEVEQ